MAVRSLQLSLVYNRPEMKRKKFSLILVVVVGCLLSVWLVYDLMETKYGGSVVLVSRTYQFRPYTLTFEDQHNLPYDFKVLSNHKGETSTNDLNVTNWKSQKRKMILFYNTPAWYDKTTCSKGVNMCPVKSCSCSTDPSDLAGADAVIVDLVDIHIPNPPIKLSNQVWISFGLETPVHYQHLHYQNEQWRKMFNWTMTYRLDSDIPIPYGIVVHKPAPNKNYTEIALRKTKSALWIVSNCDTSSQREGYVTQLRQYYNVDIYGDCGKKCPFQDCLSRLEKDYRFYLAFENSLCLDYISEKLFKIYDRSINLVPVVRGGADYASLMPDGTYINTATFSSPKNLAQYLKYLERNVTAYAETLARKDLYVRDNEAPGNIHAGFCDICVKMNNLDKFSNHYHNNAKWLIEKSCYIPDDH